MVRARILQRPPVHEGDSEEKECQVFLDQLLARDPF